MARERLDFDIFAHDRNAKSTFEGVADGADGTKKSFDDLGKQSKHLDSEILRLEKSTKDLVAAFRSTDDVEIFKQFKKDKRQLNMLREMRKELLAVADVAGDAGRSSARSFMDGIGALPSQLKGALIVGAVGAAAAAAPAIGAIVGGAVVAGVGAAGIGTGVALAFQDSRVEQAAGDLGMRAKNAFISESAGMIEPTIQSLDVLGDAAVDVAGEMGGMWDDLAPEVVPLAEAIGDMARNVMPGLRDAIEVAKPALRILSRELPEIGDAFSDMFSTISEEGDGALLGLVAVLDGVEGAIRTTGDVVAFLSMAFEDGVRAGVTFTGAMEDILGWMPVIGDKFREANDRGERWLAILDGSKQPSDVAARASKDVRDAVAEAGEAAEKASDRFDTLFDQWMGSDNSAIAVEEAIDRVTESLDENGTSLDIFTEKGRENAKSFLRGAEAADLHRQKMIESGQSIPYANKVFQETIDKLYAEAAAAGVSRSELDRLLGKYRDLANAPNITKTITYKQVFTSSGQAYAPVGGGHAFFSHGGLMVGPGSGTSDDIVARVSNGEYVLRAAAVQALGVDTLNALNQADRTGLRGPTPGPPSAGVSAGGGGPDVVRALEAALERVFSRVTLRIDDRTARFSDLLVRGG